MERRRFGNADLTVSAIGLGCYGMSGAYGPADDVESIATISLGAWRARPAARHSALTQSITARTQAAGRRSRWTMIQYSAAIRNWRGQPLEQGMAVADIAGQCAAAGTGADRFQMHKHR
jgi:hypothetical protein